MSDAETRIAAILAEIGARDVLDIGCGGGGLVRALAARGHAVTGLDPAEAAIAAARARGPDARLIVGAAEALPLGDATFDACVFLNALHHVPVPRMRTALGEALRVLRPGGAVVIVEPLAAGPFFEVMRPVEDETAIRRAAIAAIDAVLAAGDATGPAPVTWQGPTPVADLDAFIETLARVDPARRAAADGQRATLARLFARHARRTPDGPVLDQPLRLWRLHPG